MTDQEIVGKLIEKDPVVTYQFFFVKCRPLFLKLIRMFYNYPVEYDEFVNEVAMFLMENDCAKLRSFKFESSIYYWLRTCLLRHFIRNRGSVIENVSNEPLYVQDTGSDNAVSNTDAKIDIAILLDKLSKNNERYALVIRLLMIEGVPVEEVAEEIGVRVSNLYNIKKRAIKELTKIALER